MLFHKLLKFAGKRALPGRYRVRPSRKRESDMDAPWELALLDGKTRTANHVVMSRDSRRGSGS